MEEKLLDPYKDTIIKLVVKQVLEYAIKRAAWLSLGPVNWIASLILSKIFSIALEQTILGINMWIVDLENDGDVKEFNKLLAEAKATPKEDLEKNDEIERKLIESGKNLIRIIDSKRL